MELVIEILKWYGIGCIVSALMFAIIILMSYKKNKFIVGTVFPLIGLISWVGVGISMILLIKLIRVEIRLKKIKSKYNTN